MELPAGQESTEEDFGLVWSVNIYSRYECYHYERPFLSPSLHLTLLQSPDSADLPSKMVRVLSEVEDNVLVMDTLNTDLGLAQCEVSDSEAGSSSSFEVLLPDFSSLGISDDTNKENCATNDWAEKRKSAGGRDGASYCDER